MPTPTSDEEFGEYARQLFQYQFERNLPYRKFCLQRRITPDQIKTHRDWPEIPPLPVMAFKHAEIACRPMSEAAHIFYSSGTTERAVSRHALFDPHVTRAAIVPHFAKHMMPEGQKMRLIILTPSPEDAPHSSLSFMMDTLRVAFGTPQSRHYMAQGRLSIERLAEDMAQADDPICLLGTSFAFVHLIDFYLQKGLSCTLPQGSRLMDTGGFKGKSREVTRAWLYAHIKKLWGIDVENCVNEYGMTEMTSQFYDGAIGEDRDAKQPRPYRAPPHVRTRILCPKTLKPLAAGEIGLLAHYDLANVESVFALLTEDLGCAVEGGFLLAGRAAHAEMRGCSIGLDALPIA